MERKMIYASKQIAKTAIINQFGGLIKWIEMCCKKVKTVWRAE